MPETKSQPDARKLEAPDLRREFVGMMFALAVGEIGLQVASLVQAKHVIHYLPAYSHLFLAMFVIALSWVGWSRTAIPGGKKDVEEPFEWPFLVLLLDMAMVVTYFILVRTVDFADNNRRIDPADEVAFWHVLIFGLYVVWDVVTKVAMYERPSDAGWLRGWALLDSTARKEQVRRILRTAPTLICFAISWFLYRVFSGADGEFLLTADLALLSVVLLFRALKSLVPAMWPSEADLEAKKPRRLLFRASWSAVLVACLCLGTWATIYSRSLLLPDWVVHEIRTPIATDVSLPVPVTSAVPPAPPASSLVSPVAPVASPAVARTPAEPRSV